MSTDFYPPDGDEHLDELLNPQADAAKLLNFERPFRKVKRYYDAVRSIPGHLRDAWLLLLRVLSSWDELRAFVLRVWQTIKHLPVVSFYGYLWRTNKAHFAMNLFVSYALPAILEALPWYFSRRKIGRELRDVRNKIHNQMVRILCAVFAIEKREKEGAEQCVLPFLLPIRYPASLSAPTPPSCTLG